MSAPFFGEPPPRIPIPAEEVPALRGKRVILSRPDGFLYDMRAASEVYVDERGRRVVDIVSEEHWYRWMFLAVPPKVEPYRIDLVWSE